MPDAFLTGAGLSRFGRRGEALETLAREAATAALDDAGSPGIDALFVASVAPEDLCGAGNLAARLATALGLAGVAATRVEAGPASGSAAVEAAVRAVQSGAVETALALGVEAMTHVATPEATRILSRMLDERERSLGLTLPALAGLVASRYLRVFGVAREDLALAPVKAHAAGARNPLAQFRRGITVAEVLASPLVADPLRVYDCAPLTDGAAAVVVTSRPGPVRVAGIGHATDALALTDRRGPEALTSFRATRLAAQRAYAASGLRPADVDVAEVHDAFSILELVSLEDLGFFPPGDSVAALRKGETALGGRLPVNPSGGLKARGHPVGATGVAQVAEIVLQLGGRAGSRQVDGARVGLTQNVGGFGNNNFVLLFEGAAA